MFFLFMKMEHIGEDWRGKSGRSISYCRHVRSICICQYASHSGRRIHPFGISLLKDSGTARVKCGGGGEDKPKSTSKNQLESLQHHLSP